MVQDHETTMSTRSKLLIKVRKTKKEVKEVKDEEKTMKKRMTYDE